MDRRRRGPQQRRPVLQRLHRPALDAARPRRNTGGSAASGCGAGVEPDGDAAVVRAGAGMVLGVTVRAILALRGRPGRCVGRR